MKSVKLKQFAVSLLAIFSLFASSFSACACSHHQDKPGTNLSSCHEHSPETKAEKNHDNDSAKPFETSISEAGCFCLQLTPKIAAQTEIIKVKKHAAATALTVKPIAIIFIPQIIAVKVNFAKPFYLSDSFYDLSPGRAPPGL